MTKPDLLSQEAEAVRAKIATILRAAETGTLTASGRKSLDREMRGLILELEGALARIDRVSMPTSVFDPSNPKIVGRFTALAMVGQRRFPLAAIAEFYGSGVYAIYYRGRFPLYAPLSGSETPIYVGKAAPASEGARTPREQGRKLSGRLAEHRKNIVRAATTLDIADFEARFLVVQSGWERSAEDYLISLFRPIWNSEVGILYGLGKHGDDATTRANKRSPWDTLHPGRAWASATTADAKSEPRIAHDLETHFARWPVFPDISALLEAFFAQLRQG